MVLIDISQPLGDLLVDQFQILQRNVDSVASIVIALPIIIISPANDQCGRLFLTHNIPRLFLGTAHRLNVPCRLNVFRWTRQRRIPRLRFDALDPQFRIPNYLLMVVIVSVLGTAT